MADKHTSETNYLSLKEMVKSYAQSKWLYLNRAFGGNRYHRGIDGYLDASTKSGPGARQACYLS
jgi:hypothetical protein